MDEFITALRRIESAVRVLGADNTTRDDLHELMVVKGDCSEETFFFAWCAATI